MIEKNFIGMIFVIVGLVILISFFVNWNNDMGLLAQRKAFEDLSDNLEYLCSVNEGANIYYEIEHNGDEYAIKIIDDKSLCMINSDGEYFCERFLCEKVFSSDAVLINNTKDASYGYRCSLDVSHSVLNISCSRMYD